MGLEALKDRELKEALSESRSLQLVQLACIVRVTFIGKMCQRKGKRKDQFCNPLSFDGLLAHVYTYLNKCCVLIRYEIQVVGLFCV